MSPDTVARFDVCVLGAGPAGVAAATELLRVGNSVVLIESTVAGRPRPGEHLTPEAATAFGALGVPAEELAAVSEPSPGRVICWGTETVEESPYLFASGGRAANMDRPRLDWLLRAHAVSAGATLVVGGRVRAARYDGKGWTLEVAAGGFGGPDGSSAAERRMRCAVVIDATGRRASFARSLGARMTYGTRLVAAVDTIAGYRSSDRRLVLEAGADGWWYCVPLPGDRLVVGWVTAASVMRAGTGPGAAFEGALAGTRLIRDLVASAGHLPDRELQLLAASSGLCEPMSGPGWLAVGDAAAQVDPLWGRGLPHAVELGLRAAEAALLPPTDRPAAFEAYEAVVRERWLAAQRTGAEWYQRAARRFDTPFWSNAYAGGDE